MRSSIFPKAVPYDEEPVLHLAKHKKPMYGNENVFLYVFESNDDCALRTLCHKHEQMIPSNILVEIISHFSISWTGFFLFPSERMFKLHVWYSKSFDLNASFRVLDIHDTTLNNSVPSVGRNWIDITTFNQGKKIGWNKYFIVQRWRWLYYHSMAKPKTNFMTEKNSI